LDETPQMGPRGRILALDVGQRRIGLALSDELGITAQGLPTRTRTRIREDLRYLKALAGEKGVTLLLVGNPLQMDGREGAQSAYVREFAARLGNYTGLPVQLWDERLTTVEAEEILYQGGASFRERKEAVDRMAAMILLRDYLDTL
jgi:putative holliday junction resolvase